MLITSEMLAYAAAEYPNASLKALQVAQDNYPDQSPGTEQSDYDCYICSLAEAVIEFPAEPRGYSEYVPKNERPVISALIAAILATENGQASCSVNDSEDWVLRRAVKPGAIRAALGSSGEDLLQARAPGGEVLGWFYLIYNNGSEGDPMIVIADYSANDYCDQIYNTLYARYSD